MREPGTEDWAAVADAVRERKRELKMTTAELAREARLSPTTVRYLGRAPTSHKSALVAISGVLRWRYDYLVNILNGEPEKNARVKAPTATSLERLLRDEATKLARQLTAVSEALDIIKWQLKQQQRFSPQQPAPAVAVNSRQQRARLAARKRSTPRRGHPVRPLLARRLRAPRKTN